MALIMYTQSQIKIFTHAIKELHFVWGFVLFIRLMNNILWNANYKDTFCQN